MNSASSFPDLSVAKILRMILGRRSLRIVIHLSVLRMWRCRHRGLSLPSIPVVYPPITYYWTGLLILDHSNLVWNLTNSKIAETDALEPLKS